MYEIAKRCPYCDTEMNEVKLKMAQSGVSIAGMFKDEAR